MGQFLFYFISFILLNKKEKRRKRYVFFLDAWMNKRKRRIVVESGKRNDQTKCKERMKCEYL